MKASKREKKRFAEDTEGKARKSREKESEDLTQRRGVL